MGILLIHFRRMGDTLLALIPVVLSLIWTLGLWSLFGFHMNFINIIVLPMILGIGVHAGLHLLERSREMGHRRLNLVMETTGRGLLLTALTTIVGFGSLAMAQFRGLQEIGLLVIIGVGTNLLATLIIPARDDRFIERGFRSTTGIRRNWTEASPQTLFYRIRYTQALCGGMRRCKRAPHETNLALRRLGLRRNGVEGKEERGCFIPPRKATAPAKRRANCQESHFRLGFAKTAIDCDQHGLAPAARAKTRTSLLAKSV
jgi:hypothetical protein